jgi:hypothetical protein
MALHSTHREEFVQADEAREVATLAREAPRWQRYCYHSCACGQAVRIAHVRSSSADSVAARVAAGVAYSLASCRPWPATLQRAQDEAPQA